MSRNSPEPASPLLFSMSTITQQVQTAASSQGIRRFRGGKTNRHRAQGERDELSACFDL